MDSHGNSNYTKKFNKILVGVDDAPDARAAFDYAVDKAKREAPEIGIVSILESNDINVYQALDKDYIHSTHDQLNSGSTNTSKQLSITE
jgi:Universal stress protein family.